MKKHENIIDLFNLCKEKYVTLNSPTQDYLKEIQSQALKEITLQSTSRYLLVISAALLTFLIFPYSVIKVYVLSNIASNEIFTFLKSISSDTRMLFNVTLGLLSASTIIYLFLMPFHTTPLSKYNTENVNFKQKNYISYSIFGFYLIILEIFILLYINFPTLRHFVIKPFNYVFFAPLAIITLLVIMVLIIIVVIFPIVKNRKIDFEFSDNYRYEIAFKLLKILESLKDREKIQIISKIEANRSISELIKIKNLIKNYHLNSNSEDNLFLVSEFEKAANAFQNCIDRFILEEEQIEQTKQLLIDYTNIFLTGNIASLPKEEIVSEKQSRTKTKFIHYVLFGLYLTLPIFIMVILKTIFKMEIDQYVQSLLQILYVVWAFIGIFSNPFILNDDNKELIRDILKTLTGKGE